MTEDESLTPRRWFREHPVAPFRPFSAEELNITWDDIKAALGDLIEEQKRRREDSED
jgi:hypothetical protein